MVKIRFITLISAALILSSCTANTVDNSSDTTLSSDSDTSSVSVDTDNLSSNDSIPSESSSSISTTPSNEVPKQVIGTIDNTVRIYRDDIIPYLSDPEYSHLLSMDDALSILQTKVRPDSNTLIKEIDHMEIIDNIQYFVGHVYSLNAMGATMTYGWYIINRENGALYKENMAAHNWEYNLIDKDEKPVDTPQS